MAGQDETQSININPALERAQRVERAFIHVSKAIELDLADVALDGGEVNAATEQELREIGAVLLRVSQIGMNTANSLAVALGESPTLMEPAKPTNRTTARPITKPPIVATAQTPVAAEQTQAEPAALAIPRESRLSRQRTATESTPRGRKTAERVHYDGELYQRIVMEKETPKMELREGMEPIPVRIITDDVIIVNGEKIMLDGDKLFVFNAIMKLRDEISSGKNMRQLGFRLQGSGAAVSTTFSKAMAELMQDLEQATGPTGVSIIKKLGKAAGTKYAVNPAVTLIDERFDDSIATPDETPGPVKKN